MRRPPKPTKAQREAWHRPINDGTTKQRTASEEAKELGEIRRKIKEKEREIAGSKGGLDYLFK